MSDPDFYSFVDFEPSETFEERRQASIELQSEGGATFGRFTIITDEHPNEPYPHGFYIEGWRERPREQPPFNYPLTAALTQGD